MAPCLFVANTCPFLKDDRLFSYACRREHLAGKEASATSLRKEVEVFIFFGKCIFFFMNISLANISGVNYLHEHEMHMVQIY